MFKFKNIQLNECFGAKISNKEFNETFEQAKTQNTIIYDDSTDSINKLFDIVSRYTYTN